MLRIGDRVGPYRLDAELGQGGFGTVYRAVRVGGVEIPVALKVARERSVGEAEFLHEARTWVRASGHPNVVPVLDAGVYDGEFVLASEYVQGGSLRQQIGYQKGKRLPAEEAARLIDGLLLGLEHLHEQEVVHRDLKPENVLLQKGIPRLTDFGISRVQSGTAHTQHRAGTPAYMPPEAFRKVVSIQTDVWACGVLLFELLAGRLPFYDDDMFALMDAIRAAPVPTLPAHVPPEVRAVVECALARERPERYLTAASMREALTAALRPKPLPVDGADLYAELTMTPTEARNGGTFIVGDGRWRVNVPADGGDGYEHRYRDRGERGRHGGRNGDLVLHLRVPPAPGPQLGDTHTNPKDGAVMVWVPPGTFLMGDDASPHNAEKPAHRVVLTQGFWLYRTPVTVAQYRTFCEATGRALPTAPPWGWQPEHPVVNVTWADAAAYSEWAGAQLPTEAQWEYAARGPEGRTYPWGDETPNPSRAVYGQSSGTAPVGSKPAGASWCGALDLAGNVWEWCRDEYDDTYYSRSPQKDPVNEKNDSIQFFVLRGGSFDGVPDDLRAAYRSYYIIDHWYDDVGFRSVVCAPEDY